VKIIVGYTKVNISRTTHWFQINILAVERSILSDAFQLFYQCNPTNIDPNMTILDGMIATQSRDRILVRQEKCNNSTTTDPFQSVGSALERPTSVDARRVVDHQNPTSIGKDTIICVSRKISQVQHVILFVVTNLITPQQFVHFKPADQCWKIQIMKMRLDYLIVRIRKILVVIQRFLIASIGQSIAPSSLFVVTIVVT
jgi:hypothetical protein